MIELVPGFTYYELTFADVGMTMPGVKPLVYVGVNLGEEDDPNGEPIHYFQTTVSYKRFGPATAPHTEGVIDLVPYRKRSLQSSIFTLPGMVDVVSAAAKRAAATGYPRLRTAPGNWQSFDPEEQ